MFQPADLPDAPDALWYGFGVQIDSISIVADFRNKPEKAVAARLREIAGVFERVAAKLGG